MQLVGRKGEKRRAQWSAQDALVLKWVALQITEYLPRHARCAHVKGHGGGREFVRQVARALMSGEFSFVYRTDIRGYYRNIDKTQLQCHIQIYVPDPVLLSLLYQYLHYSVEDGGEIYTPTQGICRSCSLSPLFGASLLYHVDKHFDEQKGIFYARYMDDFLLLTRSRWPLRHGVKQLHEFLNLGGFETHPDKTQLGRIEHGFDWLGVWFSAAEPTIAPRAIANYHATRLRLYEQARRRGLSAAATNARV